MVAPRPIGSLQPDDLHTLLTLFKALPPPPARFSTIQGQSFLKTLRALSAHYTRRELAAALGVAVQTIHNWEHQRVIRNPRKWPGDDDVRELRAALRIALALGRQLRRQRDEWGAVHAGLTHLLGCGFEIHEIALALDVPTRKLRRFEQPQLPDPHNLSRSVHAATHAPRQDE